MKRRLCGHLQKCSGTNVTDFGQVRIYLVCVMQAFSLFSVCHSPHDAPSNGSSISKNSTSNGASSGAPFLSKIEIRRSSSTPTTSTTIKHTLRNRNRDKKERHTKDQIVHSQRHLDRGKCVADCLRAGDEVEPRRMRRRELRPKSAPPYRRKQRLPESMSIAIVSLPSL